jgi:DNA-binding SARP family transcriptional activator
MQFQILGPLRVTDDNEREIALGGAKPAAVLAMLLLHPNEVVSAYRLIDDLWEGDLPPTASKTLQVHISRLRRAFGDDAPIATARGGYVLEVDPEQIDAGRFESLVAEGTAALAEGAHGRASARLRAALALWRGQPLTDFAYASFAQDEIARLDGLRTVAVEQAVEAELGLGRHGELIPELKALVKRYPLSEHLRAQLMLALYRSGRQAEALGVYRAARRVLVDLLGIEPSAELREMERAILAQDAQLTAPSVDARRRSVRAESSQRGTFVGYEGELASLEDVLEQSLTGAGRLALVSGEPGVGKTRLCDELSAVADARGAHVVWGRCTRGGGAPAYWPWIQVLRALASDRDAATLRTELGDAAPELTQLLPELHDVVADGGAPAKVDPDEARFRLHDAVAGFIKRVASSQPLVVVLDDLHAADQSTLSLLQFAAGALLGAPVLIVATYRDTEAAMDRVLTDTLSEIARMTDCVQLVLTGLSDDDTAHFVELSAGVAPMPALASAIHDASSGNPLFVSELVRLLRAENRLHELERGGALALPRGVDQVIARRLERLSDDCRQTLALASVAGRDFDLTLLTRAGDAPPDDVLAHLDDAVSARVVEPVGSDAFRFSHDLVRQALYTALGARDRRRLHDAVGRAIEDIQGTRAASAAGDLAHHFSEALPAGDPAKAIQYLTLAGDQATDVAAHHEAAALYERAVEVAEASEGDATYLCDLYIKLGEQLVRVPAMERAKLAIASAEALSSEAPDRARDARIAILRAHLVLLDDSVVDQPALHSAIELFEEMGDPVGAAKGYDALIVLCCGRSDRLQGLDIAEKMLDCARRAGSRAMTARAFQSIAGNIGLGGAPVGEGIIRIRQLLKEADDGLTRGKLMCQLARLTAKQGRFDEGRELLARALADAPPSEREIVEGYFNGIGVQLELMAGNWRRAEEYGRANCDPLEAQGLVRYLSSELMFLVDALTPQGKFEEAEAILERAAPYASPDDLDALFRQARSRARLELARGNADAALAAIRRAIEWVEEGEAPDEHAETLLVLADVQRTLGDHAEAAEAAAEAMRMCDESGNVVLVQRARELLDAPAVVAAT